MAVGPEPRQVSHAPSAPASTYGLPSAPSSGSGLSGFAQEPPAKLPRTVGSAEAWLNRQGDSVPPEKVDVFVANEELAKAAVSKLPFGAVIGVGIQTSLDETRKLVPVCAACKTPAVRGQKTCTSCFKVFAGDEVTAKGYIFNEFNKALRPISKDLIVEGRTHSRAPAHTPPDVRYKLIKNTARHQILWLENSDYRRKQALNGRSFFATKTRTYDPWVPTSDASYNSPDVEGIHPTAQPIDPDGYFPFDVRRFHDISRADWRKYEATYPDEIAQKFRRL